jgi:hypothetical protein
MVNVNGAYDTHGTTYRSWLVEGQEVHIHVHCRRGLSCPSDCLVSFYLLNEFVVA